VLDSLFARYTFDSSISPETDDSGSLRDGTINGALWVNDGLRGGVLEFDGLSSYMVIPSISGGTPELTFSSWINLASLPSTLSAIYAVDQWSPQGFHYNLRFSGAVEAGVEGNTPVAVQSNRSFGAGDFGQWFHIAVVYDSTAMTTQIYIDGALDNSVAHTAVYDARLLLARIGGYSGSARWFDGRMDDVRLYSRALSGSEINRVYNATK
jgi:hypothetical protein